VTLRFSADLPEIESHLERAHAFAVALDEALEKVENSVSEGRLTWSGMAADAHRLAHREWARGAREMHAALVVMVSAARRARDGYDASATANARMWSSLA
jgi:WXG100 family type VII secretion target